MAKKREVQSLYRFKRSSQKSSTKVRNKTAEKAKPLRTVVPVPRTRVLVAQTRDFIWKNRKPLFGVLAIYAITYTLLVSGLGGRLDLSSIQLRLENIFGKHDLTNNLITTGVVLLSAGSGGTAAQQIYQMILPLIGTIAIVWTIRKLHSKEPFRLRDAYYRSMQPIIPLLLVWLVMIVKIIPLALGTFVYVTVKSNQLAVNTVETVFFVAVWVASLIVSLYLMVPNALAIYAVTLPDVDPRQAVLATKHMVKGQRMKVLGRIAAGVSSGALVIALVVLASIAWFNFLTPTLTLLSTFVGFLALHVYMYHVYRSML